MRLGLAAIAGAGLVALLFLSVIAVAGFSSICFKGVLCERTASEKFPYAQGVHLVWPEDPARGFKVMWETASRQDPPYIEWRAKGETEWRKVEGISQRTPRNGILPGRGYLHWASVSDLSPGETYEYRVSNDRTHRAPAMSETFETRTHDLGRDVVLAFIADTGLRGRPDGLAGGIDAIMNNVLEDAPDAILGGGDYAYADWDGRFVYPDDAVRQWFRDWQPVLSKTPLLAQFGNHECCHKERTALWAPYFAAPANQSPDGRSYSVDIGEVHLAGFFAMGDNTVTADKSSLAWLDKDLGAAREREQRYLVVFQHNPLYSHGSSHPAILALRDQMAPVLERHKVDLHLSAHDQVYERTFPLRTDDNGDPLIERHLLGADWPGVIYAKISPAGKRSDIGRDFSKLPKTEFPEIAVSDDTAYHYALVTIHPDGALSFQAFSVNADGDKRLLDAFTIDRETQPNTLSSRIKKPQPEEPSSHLPPT